MKELVIYFVLIATVLVSGSLVFVIPKREDRTILRFLLAFSGAFLIGLTFLKLVPEIFSRPLPYTGLFVLAGFLLQLVLELITEGAEHGHPHQHTEQERVSPFLLLIGLCVHSFFEGMPIVPAFDVRLQHTLVLGIVVHKFPVSLALMSLFIHYHCSARKAFIYLLIFALMTPLGSITGRILQVYDPLQLTSHFNYLLAIVVGIFLHVSTSILFETEENHKYNLQKFGTVLVGLAFAWVISIL